jgi:nucleoside-diphosphate-sugar epimerase
VTSIALGELTGSTDYRDALEGFDVVVHAAARVHVMRETDGDPLAAFRAANVDTTLNLARQAAQAGVTRFVFISTIKVYGESSPPGRPFTAEDYPAPVDPYAISKYEAEQGLWQLAQATGMELVIVRPPLVYGPGVKGNFQQMIKWLRRGIPLPLKAIHNRRSLVALDNLVDLLMTCVTHPAAANQILLVSDGEDLSTPELLTRLGDALGKPARLFSVPPALLLNATRLLGQKSAAERLCGTLQVDISRTRELLGWQPPVTVEQALQALRNT